MATYGVLINIEFVVLHIKKKDRMKLNMYMYVHFSLI